jgi:2-polyprenyl-3-methyl-5-hydroxy-6-metoxy-1,4-benzoquinol methylase
MNRKARRAGLKPGHPSVNAALSDGGSDTSAIADLMTQASWHHQRGDLRASEDLCKEILAREPAHVHALNLLGLCLQGAGRHKAALKVLKKAIASDSFNAACHYNIASSYQALNTEDEAEFHFKQAIALGARRKSTEELILQNPVIALCVGRIEEKWPLPAKIDEVFGPGGLAPIATDLFLRCALETVLVCGAPLEKFLTFVRATLLGLAYAATVGTAMIDSALTRLFCALAQQCFISEYVFAQSDQETRQSVVLRELLQQATAEGRDIPPLLLAAVASYFPLHSLPEGPALLGRDWPRTAAGLVRQQIREPLQEAKERDAIPALTSIDDDVSLRVMRQYEENPYPRWTVNPLPQLADAPAMRAGRDLSSCGEILIAGCGSGQHAFEVAQCFPQARVLAIDVSLPSLAYARRKTTEAGLRNVEYAQADLLKLAAVGRSFDRIEAVGVLHHLADPEAGWRALLSLLRPNSEMRVGLYSETARRAIVEVRALISQRGYRPTTEDIRECRQEILRADDQTTWKAVISAGDFYSVSGCRDLLFHVMERRFTIPRIKAFLDAEGLEFLGFDLDPAIIERFQRRFPDRAALRDLEFWRAFEADNPQAFHHMYVFVVKKA